MNEQLKIKGVVDLTIRHKDGRVEQLHYDNLVVTAGRKVLMRMLGGDAAYLDPVSKVGFGTSNAAPAPGQTDLQTPIAGTYKFAVATTSYPSDNSVKFEYTLDDATGNGNTIRELGLFTDGASPYLFSRVIIGDVVKDDTKTIEVAWTINL